MHSLTRVAMESGTVSGLRLHSTAYKCFVEHVEPTVSTGTEGLLFILWV